MLVYLRAVLLPASGVAAIETESAGVDLSAGGGGKGGLVFKLRLQVIPKEPDPSLYLVS